MKMGRKTLLYPYHYECAPLLRHASLCREHEIVRVVSPKGWALHGKDAAFADRGEETGLTVSDDFEAALDAVDAVMICDVGNMTVEKRDAAFFEMITGKIAAAIGRGKDIVCLMKLPDTARAALLALAQEKGVGFSFVNTREPADNDGRNRLHKISVPVVFVLGCTDNTDKFAIQLGLTEQFRAGGYHAVSVGSRGYGELWGLRPFPDFLYADDMGAPEKVSAFNRYLFELEGQLSPDIFIIGVPGGIMSASDLCPGDFGILAYMLSNAVRPDYAVLSMNYNASIADADYFDDLNDIIKTRFGYPIRAFNMSGNEIDWNEVSERETLSFLGHSLDETARVVEKCQTLGGAAPVFNLKRKDELDRLYAHIVNTLSGENQVEVVNQKEYAR